MRVLLFAFGKLKNPGMREAADYYLKLIRPWVEVQELELKPIAVPDKSEATRRRIQEQEGQELLSRIHTLERLGRIPFYILDEGGKTLPTRKWAEMAMTWQTETPELALVIGSSLGFSDEVRKKARGALSFGPQTLPHELARVVLLEQLYRAWSVIKKHPYHNEGA